MTARILVVGDTVDAALAALFSRRRGADVVLCPQPRALSRCSPSIALFTAPARRILDGTFAADAALAALDAVPHHPYRTLFAGKGGTEHGALADAARAAARDLVDVMARTPMPFEGDPCALRVGLTEWGTLVSAGLTPVGMAVFEGTSLPRRMELLALAHDATFPASMVAQSLEEQDAGASATVRTVDLGLPVASSWIEAGAGVPWDAVRDAAATGPRGGVLMAPRHRGPGAPPAGIRELLPVDVPSATGLRFEAAIQEALRTEGVGVVEELPEAVDASGSGPALLSRGADGTVRRIEADRVIVAPGRFAADGIGSTPRVHCPLLGPRVPVWLHDRAEERIDGERHFSRRLLDRHDVFRMGVRVDAALRPLTDEGEPLSPRLHAAGTVIAGPHGPTEGSGFGLLTAWLAARHATEAS